MAKKSVPVKGYTRQDGVVVDSHVRKVQSNGPPNAPKKESRIGDALHQLVEDKDERFREIGGHKIPLAGYFSNAETYNSEKISFVGMDLSGADFSDVDLNGADFTGANLSGANFTGARLWNVILTDANIKDSVFSETRVSGLSASSLDFAGTVLNNSVFYFSKDSPRPRILNLPSNLKSASFAWADLSGQDLSHFDMGGPVPMTWLDVNFGGSNLSGVNMKRISFFGCDFTGADLSNVQAQNTSWSDSVASDTNFEGANLNNAFMDETEFIGCNFSGSSFGIKKAFCTDFSGANFSGANFVGAPLFASCFLDGANLSNADLGKTCFADSSEHPGAYRDFSGEIDGCDLRGVVWVGAKTSDMTVSDTNIHSMPNVGGDGVEDEVEEKFTAVAMFNMYSFDRAVADMGLSDEQFEFLVLSKVIEVRDRETHEVVKMHFDRERHYVPDWAVQSNPVAQ